MKISFESIIMFGQVLMILILFAVAVALIWELFEMIFSTPKCSNDIVPLKKRGS